MKFGTCVVKELLKVVSGICVHRIIVSMVLSYVKKEREKGEDRNFIFLLFFIPIYSDIVTDTVFLTLGIHSPRSLDVLRYQEHAYKPYYCGAISILLWVCLLGVFPPQI